jgi:hypothetical protein
LHLSIKWPTAPATIELIASCGSPISSLTLDAVHNPDNLYERLRNLNMKSLKVLTVKNSECRSDELHLLLDLAAQSTQPWIKLSLELGRVTASFLDHQIMPRIDRLSIESGKYLYTNLLRLSSHESIVSDESLDSVNALLPSLKTLKIRGDYRIFKAFDLTDVKNLEFTALDGPSLIFDLSRLPTGLVDLELGEVNFGLDFPSSNGPFPLPHLTRLRLYDLVVQGSLNQYLLVPELIHLTIHRTKFHPVDEVHSYIYRGREERRAARMLSDSLFLRRAPKLQSLSLENMDMDESFVAELRLCPRLRTLNLSYCLAAVFVRGFYSCLDDDRFFPSLETLELNDSWPDIPEMTYPEFFDSCWMRRPDLDVCGDGEDYSDSEKYYSDEDE